MSTIWRPHPKVRPIAIGIVRRGGELLVVEVTDDNGNVTGWRPPGGAIEFGERAAAALRREFLEELRESITEPELITVLENLYRHHGEPGHDIVFAFATAFADAAVYRRDVFKFDDVDVACTARWVGLERFRSQELDQAQGNNVSALAQVDRASVKRHRRRIWRSGRVAFQTRRWHHLFWPQESSSPATLSAQRRPTGLVSCVEQRRCGTADGGTQ